MRLLAFRKRLGKIKEYKEKKRMKHSWVIEKMKGACRVGSAYK